MDDEAFDQRTGEMLAAPAMPPAIAAAIIAVKKQVKALGSDERNEHGRYSYVSVDKFYERIGKLMADAGLALLIDETSTDVRAGEQRADRDKPPAPWLFAQYALAFMHESGAMSATLRRSIALPISGPQAFGAAQSYIEKQFLRQVFKVPTGEKDADDTPTDGEAPESRSRAHTAQERREPSRSAPRRPEAAPAPSAAQLDATKRWDELDALIDIAKLPRDLDGLDGCEAWVNCHKKIADAEGRAVVADIAMQNLRDRIEAKRQDLLGSMG